MTDTMGLAIQATAPVYPVIESQHQTTENKPSKWCGQSWTVADLLVVQGWDVMGPKANQGTLGGSSSA